MSGLMGNKNKGSLLGGIAKSKWSWLTVLIVTVLVIYSVLKVRSMIAELKYGLTPPVLEEYRDLPVEYINQTGWGEDKDWYYHVSQGTSTLPIPYQWLLALEEPKSSPWHIFFGSGKPFIDEYIQRIGFIGSDSSDGLPIGIAKTESIYFPGINRKATAAGFTCAACHTGQLVQNNTRYVIDGGPAMMDLGLLTQSLGAALGQTALSSQLMILDGRFERFAKNVLGSDYNIITKKRLKGELIQTLKLLASNQDIINVTEGFTRLDALNRIGNQVFDRDLGKKGNYAPIDAPVNYPHIWTTSWFDWVQYDGSIMQPLIRNTGEALGVSAYVNTAPNKDPNQLDTQFSSSVPVRNLHAIEEWMAGGDPFKYDPENPKFTGLQAPSWPASFPSLDTSKVEKGSQLYQELCQGCHLPPVDSKEFWQNHWYPISYTKNNQKQSTDEKYIKLNIIPLEHINTDPAQASVLVNRTVDTVGLGLDTEVCTPVSAAAGTSDNEQAELAFVTLKDSATASFALALGAFVQETNDQWFKQNYTAPKYQTMYEGGRPNCLQAGQGYKARPLNGIWATAPFLHNGSVANLYDLLSNTRPDFVELGSLEFDTQKVGIVQSKAITQRKAGESYRAVDDYENGRFILDTREPGNHNTGHLFDSASSGKPTIGRKLAEDEKLALIEYLKTL